MTTADKVTLSRILLAPLFFIIYRLRGSALVPGIVLLWILFWVMEISDYVDGRIARASSEVSDFGKLFDPFADVMARVTYFVCFAFEGIMPLWVFLIILYREFGILFLRMLLSFKGIAMGARPGGKLKAGLYMVSGLLALLLISLDLFPSLQNFSGVMYVVVQVSFFAAGFVSLASFVDYLFQYRKLTTGKR